jgi:hypothetical protein
MFEANYVDRHRVPENSPIVSVLLEVIIIDESKIIILFRLGCPPDNAISNGLQGESITSRNQHPSHHGNQNTLHGI